jgi:hypothetical protein
VMAAREAHNLKGRFDSEATQPEYYSVNSTVGIHSTILLRGYYVSPTHD